MVFQKLSVINICFSFFVLSIIGCSDSDFVLNNIENESVYELIGFNSQRANELAIDGNYLYAGTQSGIYKMNLSDSNNYWTALGLDEVDIKTLCIMDSLNYMIGADSENEKIYRTYDGGITWIPFSNGYGSNNMVPSDLISLDNTGQILFSCSQGTILKSENNGQSWHIVWSDNSSETTVNFVRIDPNNNDNIWAGGQKADSTPLLLKSIDQGNNWQRIHVYRGDTTSSVNSCINLIFHDETEGKIWLLYPTMIKETSNNGISWITNNIGDSDYIFDRIEMDKVNPDNLYLISRSITTNHLNLFKSNDGGASWSQKLDNTFDDHKVYDMLVHNSNDINFIYFATENGILKYTDNNITINSSL